MIPFNKPFLTGKELQYIQKAVESGKISGNGAYTHRCQEYFEKRYAFNKVLLTSSCTDALEMCAILLDIQPGDEVIMPSYTFVSAANAFMLRGAKIVFADSSEKTPNIDPGKIEALITPKTKAIVLVHYAGVACDMDEINAIARKHNLYVIEDAAHSIDSFYKDKPLGGLGHLSTFSFHETKNIISGEGGMLVINDEQFIERAEIIWEKGTNRSAFFRGEVDKYRWIDIGSSFLPSEVTAAFLYAQLEQMDKIQKKRKKVWESYHNLLRPLEQSGIIELPHIPDYATNNGHLFYALCNTQLERDNLIKYLKKEGVLSVFHYLPLHKSPFYQEVTGAVELSNCVNFSDRIIRLPLYYEISQKDIEKVVNAIMKFYK